MAEKELTIHRIRGAAEAAFAALTAIYTEAHPECERKSLEQLRAMLTRPEYAFLTAARDGEVVAFAICLSCRESDACLLEYMAVEREHRSGGIGQEMFRAAGRVSEAGGRFLIAEVDSDKGPSEDRVDRTRRKEFYRRLGAREVEGLNYYMPRVTEAEPPAMELMAWRAELPGAVSRERLGAWLRSIYLEVYGQAEDDPRIEFMLRGLPEDVRLI